jgi:hypothetical protein
MRAGHPLAWREGGGPAGAGRAHGEEGRGRGGAGGRHGRHHALAPRRPGDTPPRRPAPSSPSPCGATAADAVERAGPVRSLAGPPTNACMLCRSACRQTHCSLSALRVRAGPAHVRRQTGAECGARMLVRRASGAAAAPSGRPRRSAALSTPNRNLIRARAQDAATTLAVFFEVVAQAKDAAAQNAMGDQGLQQFYVQLKTAFLHANGTSRVRVTTFTRRRAPPRPRPGVGLGLAQPLNLLFERRARALGQPPTGLRVGTRGWEVYVAQVGSWRAGSGAESRGAPPGRCAASEVGLQGRGARGEREQRAWRCPRCALLPPAAGARGAGASRYPCRTARLCEEAVAGGRTVARPGSARMLGQLRGRRHGQGGRGRAVELTAARPGQACCVGAGGRRQHSQVGQGRWGSHGGGGAARSGAVVLGQVGGRQQCGRAGGGLRPGGRRGRHRAPGHAQDGDRGRL